MEDGELEHQIGKTHHDQPLIDITFLYSCVQIMEQKQMEVPLHHDEPAIAHALMKLDRRNIDVDGCNTDNYHLRTPPDVDTFSWPHL
jgi:hypothetical protein